MQLKLIIRSYHRLSPGQDTEKILQSGRLTIGRGGSNDWTLPDPTMVMSKSHCTVEGDGEAFRLTDNSTNGVFINNSEQPVGVANTVVLADGDRLHMGDYELEATIEADQAYPTPPKTVERFDEPVVHQDYGLIPDDREHGDVKSGLNDHGLDSGPLFPPPPIPDELGRGSLIGEDWNAPPSVPPMGDAPPSAPEEEFFRPPSPATQPAPIPKPNGAEPEAVFQTEPDPPPPLPPPPQGIEPPMAGTPTPPAERPRAKGAERGHGARREVMLAAFLEGAGLDSIEIPPGLEEQSLRKVGEAFRHTVVGIMSVLAARRSVKNELRLQQTTIMPADNNPLKFSIGAEEAMENLLLKEGRGYLSMRDAMIEAFDDINAHQLALIAGMQEAVTHLVKQLDPTVLEQQADKDRGLGDLLTARKAGYWDTYLRAYERIANTIDEDFDSLLGRYFSRAYEEQIDRLRRSRR